jgi:DNA-binding response OmpR family regulator
MTATHPVVPLRTGPAEQVTVTIQLAVPADVADAVCRLVEELRGAGAPAGLPRPVTPLRAAAEPVPTDAPLRIYPDRCLAVLDGAELDLTRLEFALLSFLAEHPERVFSRSRLLTLVWGYDSISGARTVDVHVRRLRAKLGRRAELIGTVRGVGYKLSRRDWIHIHRDAA